MSYFWKMIDIFERIAPLFITNSRGPHTYGFLLMWYTIERNMDAYCISDEVVQILATDTSKLVTLYD
jgi:hypothetical protein